MAKYLLVIHYLFVIQLHTNVGSMPYSLACNTTYIYHIHKCQLDLCCTKFDSDIQKQIGEGWSSENTLKILLS